jgi:D-alanine-D-alanine ligase
MARQRVALIFGGRSEEHEVSLASARSVARALAPERYEVVPFALSKEGHWLPISRGQEALQRSDIVALEWEGEERPLALSLRDVLETLARVDIAFPLVHGRYGEDGTLQGLLELLDIPYVGCDVLASALGMDKLAQKTLFKAHGLPVARFRPVERHEWRQRPTEVLKEIEADFAFPLFVKPARSGSSVAVTKARDLETLTLGIEEATRLDPVVLVEEYVNGREIEVSVLGNAEPEASVPGEIIPAREFYDYVAKYSDPRTTLVIPVSLPTELEREARALAVQAFRALQGTGMARVDLFLERETQRFVLNEVNTIPGFTAISMYPKLWEASGLPYPRLLDRLLELALERHRERRPARWTPPAWGLA